MKKNYKMKKTISIKMFINEFGENFSEHMKNRLLELEVRSVLTRKEDEYRLDIKHVEHTQHDFDNLQKEYVYGEFLVIDDTLYFSEKCIENNYIIQAPIVDTIYSNLSSADIILDGDNKAKKIDDSNIDYIVDTLLTVFPDVTQSYLNIISEMISHERN